MLPDGPARPFQNVSTLEGSVRSEHMTLTDVLIEDGEHLQSSSPGGSIADEVPGPDMTLVLGLHRQSRGVASTDDLPFGWWNP